MLQIINDDCLKIMNQMDENSIDVVITSVPYNIKKNYNSYEDNLTNEDYLKWMNQCFKEIKRLLNPDGSFFLNIGSTCIKPLIAMEVCKEACEYFILQNDITWVKNISIEKDNEIKTFGHFKPINSPRYLNNCHEKIFHFTKTGAISIDRLAIGVPYEDKSNISRWNQKQDLRCKGNCWFIPYATVAKAKNHPAGFPVKLPEDCIKLHGIEDDMVVLDPFLGAGTTLLACQNLKVSGIGIELDEHYCQISKELLAI